jgi:hypothetical protein
MPLKGQCHEIFDTGGKFAQGIVDTGGKFATGVIDTYGAPSHANISANFRKNSGLGGRRLMKKT